MLSVTQLLCLPLYVKRRYGGRRKAASLDAPPPPTDDTKYWEFGKYSWKATVEALDKDGVVDRTFIGYSQNMNITDRTQIACDRYKQPGTKCTEAQMVMKGGESDEVIFMKPKVGKMINLTNPFH